MSAGRGAPPSLATELRCDDHGHVVDLDRPATTCPTCGSLLEIAYDLDRVPADLFERAARERAAGMWRWRSLLPLPPAAPAVSLGEGDTPLLASPGLATRLGLGRLWLKNDTLMPTGSFKDRGFALAVSMARHYGLTDGFTYSSGNAGASFAAYAARAGLRATVFVEAAANEAKVAAISLYGARVYRLHYDTSEQIFAALDELAAGGQYSFVNFVNPVRHEAMKTYAYEIVERLGGAVPDVMVHPVGTGGGLWGAWQGFRELRELGVTDRVPRMIGVQPAVCAPLVDAFDNGRAESRTVGDASATIAQSIAGDSMIHGGRRLLRALRESGGAAVGVSEDDIAEAMRLLGAAAVAAEPSAAASLAALLHARER
ncbi:MAG TPA: pyridoxal-phosphate dependent enzyme, partial [Pseudonocardiaceae bacterium]|nr:pyridoxal-phosphate dependent enzyme [Pseudonocardiaceae bacterium]